MTQRDLIRKVAEITGKTQKDVKLIIDGIETAIVDIVKTENKVRLFEGVYFEGHEKAAHEARVPSTGEIITVPTKTVCKVKLTSTFKNKIA